MFCVSVLTARGWSIQQKNAMASAVSTVLVNSVMVSAPITLKKKHVVPEPSRGSAGIRTRILGCPVRSKDGLRVIALILIQLADGRELPMVEKGKQKEYSPCFPSEPELLTVFNLDAVAANLCYSFNSCTTAADNFFCGFKILLIHQQRDATKAACGAGCR